MKYRRLSTSVLRGMFIALDSLDVLKEQRAAIAHELVVRAWAEAVEEQMAETIGWCRGGRS